jgi:hypothetical protein
MMPTITKYYIFISFKFSCRMAACENTYTPKHEILPLQLHLDNYSSLLTASEVEIGAPVPPWSK